MLVPLCVSFASSWGTYPETVLRVPSVSLVNGQSIWPRIVKRVLHLLYVLLVISCDIWLEIADPDTGSLVAKMAGARVEDGVLGEIFVEVEEVEVR